MPIVFQRVRYPSLLSVVRVVSTCRKGHDRPRPGRGEGRRGCSLVRGSIRHRDGCDAAAV